MLAMTPEVQRAPEPMRAPERAYTRRIDCCEGRARPESEPARGGAPVQAAWEHTRRNHT
jgi:hypothetical protein